MTPDSIFSSMSGRIMRVSDTRHEAFLPSPMVQNHASFLHQLKNGDLICAWFGGSLEGKADICIYASVLLCGSQEWGEAQRLSFDEEYSEQNPVFFTAPDGTVWLFHTSQPSGNQDECRIRMARIAFDKENPTKITAEKGRFIDLPLGCFIRAPIIIRDDGAWILPIFRCVQKIGQKWNGSHDNAAVGISKNSGETWEIKNLENSIGCVHLSPVHLEGMKYAAFFRRRQADFVFRTESVNGGLSWEVPKATEIPNNNSSIATTKLKNGKVAIICNPINAMQSSDRRESLYDELNIEDNRPDANSAGGCAPIWGVPRAPVCIFLSNDHGLTFSQKILIEDGPGTCLTNDSIDGKNKEMSYPWLLETSDGKLHITYSYYRRAIKYVCLDAGWDNIIDGNP